MSNFRLETNYIPTYYSLFIDPDIPHKTFICHEKVSFQENSKSDHLYLHAHSTIRIKSITQSGHPLEFSHTDNKVLIKGEQLHSSMVEIEFEGSLDHPNVGFYYINDELASTQFESIFARNAFVCFDEPSIKTEYDITLRIPSHLQAFSNMPVESKQNDGKKTIWKFQKSPKMCSYLLAFAVGDFEVLSGRTKRNLPVDVIAPKGKRELMDYPLEEGIKAIEWYEDFTKVPFPLPRLQLMCVPSFQFGAMENYGLLIFRETALLGKPGVTSQSGIYRVSEVIFHEIAHQWAGDSTSPVWWNAIWLNEGFATILPFIALSEIHPDYDMMGKFENDSFDCALKFDSSSHTHPIHVEIKSEDEIDSIFDDISYAKAGCFIRMIYNYIGRDSFRKVLETYFTIFENKNADTSDFVNIFSQVMNEDWSDFFNAWTHQSNYPLIEVTPTKLILRKFTNTGPKDDIKWPLPLFITICENGVVREEKLMIKDQVDFNPKCDWFKVNSENRSICRTLYCDEILDKLKVQISSKKLSRTDRHSILIDYEAFAQAGMISYDKFLQIISLYHSENDQVVLSSLVNILNSLEKQFPVYLPLIYKFEDKFLSGILNVINMKPQKGENPGISIVRNTILTNLAIYCQRKDVIDYGISLFREFQKNNCIADGSDPNLLSFILRVGCLFTEDGYEYLGKLINETKNPEYSHQSILASGFVKKELVDKQLKISLNLNPQSIRFGILGVDYGPNSGRKAWEFFKENVETITKKLLGFDNQQLIEKLTASFSTKEDEIEVVNFFKDHPIANAQLAIQQAIESIGRKREVIEKDGPIFEKALKSLI